MNKSEVSELKKRMTKSHCTFTKMCGCYVNADKQRIVDINETFLNLDEEEFHKYLDIAKKALSGTIGNNLLNLSFPIEEEQAGGRQQFLMGLRESGLKQEELLERFYELVIETYDYPGNYLILLFHDAYDVMKKTSDNLQLDESEEVYEYLLCAICPVELSKPGLGYREEEHRIGSRIRDWVVGMPDTAFLFPAFNDRSTDIHSLLFYTRDTKEPHVEFMEKGLSCTARATATIQRQNFDHILERGLGADTVENEMLMIDIQENLNDMVTQRVELFEEEEESILLDDEQLDSLMRDAKVPEDNADKIKVAFSEAFVSEKPVAAHLIDQRALRNNLEKKEKMELVKQVAALNSQINEVLAEEKEMVAAVKTNDIVVRVKPDKAAVITKEEVGGQMCLVIPLEDEDEVILTTDESES